MGVLYRDVGITSTKNIYDLVPEYMLQDVTTITPIKFLTKIAGIRIFRIEDSKNQEGSSSHAKNTNEFTFGQSGNKIEQSYTLGIPFPDLVELDSRGESFVQDFIDVLKSKYANNQIKSLGQPVAEGIFGDGVGISEDAETQRMNIAIEKIIERSCQNVVNRYDNVYVDRLST